MIALGVILFVLCLLFLMVLLMRQNSPHKRHPKSTKPKEDQHGK